jgi:H+/Cl- antiporter ClcA
VALGSILADLLRVSDEERRVLVLAAMAAGLAAVFRSPLGMAIFAVEILYRNQLLTNPETSPVLFLCYQSSTVGPRSSTTRAAWSRLFSLMLVLETSGQAAFSIR